MIRKAVLEDLHSIEDTYNEHFQYEQEHTAFTVFKKGVYPTKEGAEQAIDNGALYVYEEQGRIAGSIIMDAVQPIEYAAMPWRGNFSAEEILVIHLLLVRPSMSGRGIASLLLQFAAELAQKNHRKALRLDTGAQNIPAVSLYEKDGFEIIARAPKKVGDVIAHANHLYLEKIL
ncbi:GNAT family N-acetyltransferase [uncultured Megasphaera sp.]|uniref:GNAT family N-acetyltransferase n=1 Tax=uncultured Megasphaera sp. TaxID=165188 RepID=UPI00265AF951|nr:GNAT family N-acetyltransferase [uncultured Megasphaera sp.]